MKKLATALLAAAALALPTAALADTVIDPQLYVCSGCTSSPPPPNDPTLIDPGSFNIGIAGNGQGPIVSPLLVFIGVPNGGAVPGLSVPSGTNFAAPGNYYGLNVATSGNATGVLEATMLPGSAGSAYTLSGLCSTCDGGGSSENASNWFGFDAGAGSIGIYAFALDVVIPAGGVFTGLDIENSTPGDIVVAYGCQVTEATCSGGDIGATPFTVAGAVAVPAPAMGAGIPGIIAGVMGLIGLQRRRRKQAV